MEFIATQLRWPQDCGFVLWIFALLAIMPGNALEVMSEKKNKCVRCAARSRILLGSLCKPILFISHVKGLFLKTCFMNSSRWLQGTRTYSQDGDALAVVYFSAVERCRPYLRYFLYRQCESCRNLRSMALCMSATPRNESVAALSERYWVQWPSLRVDKRHL